MDEFGNYDVIVVGAGVTGIVSAVAAAREGASVLLVESSGILGGLITGGRLSKPTGIVQPGVYRELIERAAAFGGADAGVETSYWGSYTGVFDTEVMQRVVIEVIEESGVEVLLFAHVTATVRDEGLWGVEFVTKSGPQRATAPVLVDASGDGDAAVLAGSDSMFGRPEDGLVQPMTSYFRILNVNFPELVRDCHEHPEDMFETVVPDGAGADNKDYALKFFATGFTERINQARRDGFDWIVPKDHVTLKAGLLPGEININVTRYQGNALDPRVRTRAALEVRKQAYCAFDFLKRYVGGFEDSVLLDIAPVLGVRETRRIVGDYVLTEDDVRSEARFADSIGLSNAPIDIHEPGGENFVMDGVGRGYGLPFRSLLPKGVDGMLVAGRCMSVDATAFGSARNTPVCAMTGQAAGIAAAMSARAGVTPRELPVADLQRALSKLGVQLGVETDEILADAQPLETSGNL